MRWVARLLPRPVLLRVVRRMAPGALLAAAAADDEHPMTRAARDVVLAGGAAEQLAACALDRPVLAAWCARNDVVPADPGTAAALFLMTGQLDRYRAVDPDAALIAGAIAGAGTQRRGRLLAALSGGVDPAVVAARRRTGRMVWDLPLAEAVAAVKEFGPWRPGAEADAALFDRLAAEEPARVGEPLPGVVTVDVPGQVVDMALAPDGGGVAAVYHAGGRHRLLAGGHTYDVDLSGGNLADRIAIGTTRRLLVHLGDAVIGIDRRGVARFAGGLRRDLYRGRDLHAVARLGTGWVALGSDGGLVGGGRDRAGWESPEVPGGRLAASPDGRYVAVAGRVALVLLDDRGRTLQTLPWRGEPEGIAFTGSGRLVALERTGGPQGLEARLYRWRITGGELVEEAVAALPAARNLEALDGDVLVMDAGQEALHLRDAATLEPRAAIPEATARIPYPRGAAGRVAVNRHWLRAEHTIEVYPPGVHRLALRPLSALAPGDLEALAAHDEPDPRMRRLLGLLADCLRIRFDADVALGHRTADTHEDDIALGVTRPRPDTTTG